MVKKKKNSKPAEDKHDKFKRVVTPRVKKALKAIALVSNQAGSAYSYTDEEAACIVITLQHAVDLVEKAYASSGKQEVDFSFN